MAVVNSQPFRENMKLGNEGLKELTNKIENETMASTKAPAAGTKVADAAE